MFDEIIQRDIKLHAEREWPRESCGLVVSGKYFPCGNVAGSAEEHFVIDPGDQVRCEALGQIEAVIHSHPVDRKDSIGLRYPSLTDMRQQMKLEVPWGISVVINGQARDAYFFGDSLPVAEYTGRPFVHGVFDCYSLVRDYHRKEFGVVLRNDPREWEWWEKTPELDFYSVKNLEEQGFFKVSFEELKPGDVVLGTIHSDVVNHAGIYVGNSLILHHLVNRVSRTDPIGPWLKFIHHFFRHESQR